MSRSGEGVRKQGDVLMSGIMSEMSDRKHALRAREILTETLSLAEETERQILERYGVEKISDLKVRRLGGQWQPAREPDTLGSRTFKLDSPELEFALIRRKDKAREIKKEEKKSISEKVSEFLRGLEVRRASNLKVRLKGSIDRYGWTAVLGISPFDGAVTVADPAKLGLKDGAKFNLFKNLDRYQFGRLR